jgi:hypothetical protein
MANTYSWINNTDLIVAFSIIKKTVLRKIQSAIALAAQPDCYFNGQVGASFERCN